MPLHPHLHVLIPSSTPSINLEARLYLPPPTSAGPSKVRLSRSYDSAPRPLEDLTPDERDEIYRWGCKALITAAHPWGRLGGNMLDPVIARHLVAAAYYPSPSEDAQGEALQSKEHAEGLRAAIITYNARGVGRSQGSAPWLGLGRDPEDFAAVESTAISLLGYPREILRVGYSWGSLAAVHASSPDQGLSSTLIIAPALTPFRLLSLLHRSFTTALAALLPAEPPEPAEPAESAEPVEPGAESASQRKPPKRVWMIYGTEDQFSGVGAFRAVVSDLQGRGLRGREIDGGDHFFRGESGEELQRGIREWLER